MSVSIAAFVSAWNSRASISMTVAFTRLLPFSERVCGVLLKLEPKLMIQSHGMRVGDPARLLQR